MHAVFELCVQPSNTVYFIREGAGIVWQFLKQGGSGWLFAACLLASSVGKDSDGRLTCLHTVYSLCKSIFPFLKGNFNRVAYKCLTWDLFVSEEDVCFFYSNVQLGISTSHSTKMRWRTRWMHVLSMVSTNNSVDPKVCSASGEAFCVYVHVEELIDTQTLKKCCSLVARVLPKFQLQNLNSQNVNSQNVPEPQLSKCQLPKCQLPKYKLPRMSIPKMSTPKVFKHCIFKLIRNPQCWNITCHTTQ